MMMYLSKFLEKKEIGAHLIMIKAFSFLHIGVAPERKLAIKKIKSLLITVMSQTPVQSNKPAIHLIITNNQCRHFFLAFTQVLAELAFVISDYFFLSIIKAIIKTV